MLTNNKNGYGWVSIVLHWLCALAILALLALGLYMEELDYYDGWYNESRSLHRGLGILLLFVMVVRGLWRWLQTNPDVLGNDLERKLAPWFYRGHYLFIFAIILSGYLMSGADGHSIDVFGWFELPSLLTIADQSDDAWPAELHEFFSSAYMAYLALHVLAAFKHHFISKDGTLKRILRPVGSD